MAEWALVVISTEEVQKVETDPFTGPPPDVSHKDLVWLPFTPVLPPNYDPATQVREGPSYVVDIPGNSVTQGWRVRAKTQQELDAEAAARAAIREQEVEGLPNLLTGKALFELVNDVRAVQQLPPVDDEFKNWLRNI